MESIGVLLGLAITLFVSTNVDDLFVLVGFFADRAFRRRDIIAGQYAGSAVLFALGLAGSLLSLVIPRAYLGFLGIFPILIGVRNLLALRHDRDRHEESPQLQRKAGSYGRMAGVALVTVANGGDNIGIYAPVFAVHTGYAIAVIGMVFVAMTALWCYLARWLVNHPKLGAPIRNNAHLVVPVVLIGLGFLIMYEAGSIAWLLHRPV
jgi:cadmium resistance protein CadD (predicted permease)